MIENYFYNDLGNWLYYIIIFINALLVFILAVAFHELGHVLYFKYFLKKKVQLRIQKKPLKILVGNINDYQNLTVDEYKSVNSVGILFGFIPIGICSLFFPLYMLITIPYIIGCWHDIKEFTKYSESDE